MVDTDTTITKGRPFVPCEVTQRDFDSFQRLVVDNECLCAIGKRHGDELLTKIGKWYIRGELEAGDLHSWEACSAYFSSHHEASKLWVIHSDDVDDDYDDHDREEEEEEGNKGKVNNSSSSRSGGEHVAVRSPSHTQQQQRNRTVIGSIGCVIRPSTRTEKKELVSAPNDHRKYGPQRPDDDGTAAHSPKHDSVDVDGSSKEHEAAAEAEEGSSSSSSGTAVEEQQKREGGAVMEMELVRMYVDSRFQRRGLGRLLMTHLFDYVRALQSTTTTVQGQHHHTEKKQQPLTIDAIWLTTPTWNAPGLAFYRSFGFELEKTFVVPCSLHAEGVELSQMLLRSPFS